jgi:hypothetical protein
VKRLYLAALANDRNYAVAPFCSVVGFLFIEAILSVFVGPWIRSATFGGMFPISSNSPRLLNQSIHSSVANSRASKLRHGPRRQITLAL